MRDSKMQPNDGEMLSVVESILTIMNSDFQRHQADTDVLGTRADMALKQD